MTKANETLALQIKNLSVNYRHTTALEDISLDVRDGEFLGIIGPNGGGKSTLLKAILGLVEIKSGSISIYGSEKRGARALIGYVPQFSAVDRGFPISVKETVMTAFQKGALHPFFRFNAEHERKAEEQLERVGIAHLAQRQISELSGGEFQRLLIARALAVEPRMLLLDEPTASVDPASRARIYELLGELNKSITIVLVTHDLMAVASQISSLACLNDRLVYHGAPELNESVVKEMYGCPVDIIAHGVPHRVLDANDGCGCIAHEAGEGEEKC